ncbi:hypothetical protein HBI56_235740 [Parastagonospora nodorum]|nr:hypothetical protein HBH52_148630 [Parastagonospora nodorum]KAH4061353.1 hypothetical protein HBH49_014350 [Parastagonospora nodorum]KAH4078296.1 hypothetical protein HBH46_237960 [Parastagonospora nodorum]KAH4185462.1 hypothetical protein HBI95_243240 [Parastagonospora nodorum]KAH4822948.1 hypothetical protein HBH61_000370 [Parastagonospora nodorum]
MLFTKLLLLVAAVATATPVATPAEDDPHGLNLTPAEKEIMKDPSAWQLTENSIADRVQELSPRQTPEPFPIPTNRFEVGSGGVFDCSVLKGLRRQMISLLSIRSSDGTRNGATFANWTSHENVDEFRPQSIYPIDWTTTAIDTTGVHNFCGTLLGSDPPIYCEVEMMVPLHARWNVGNNVPRDVASLRPTMKEACVRLQGRGICPPGGFIQRDCTTRSWYQTRF